MPDYGTLGDDPWPTALHESAHVCVPHALGVAVTSVTLASVKTLERCGSRVDSDLQGIIAAAGPLAEARRRGTTVERCERSWQREWAGDDANIDRRVGWIGRLQAECLAELLVDTLWDRIVWVAEMLIDRGELDAAELDELLR